MGLFLFQSDPNLTSTVMSTLWAIVLLLGVSGAIGDLVNISSYPVEGAQMRSTVKKGLLYLDLLGDNSVTEDVERTVVLKLSKEDLIELQKYVKADGESSATDVESILVRSLEVNNLQVEKPSASEEASVSSQTKFHLDVDHFNENSVIMFQV